MGIRLTWEVTLPEVTRSRLGSVKPRGTLVIHTKDFGEEEFMLPLAVARSLMAARDAGDIDPESRAELLYEMRERSLKCAKDRVGRLIDRRDYSAKEVDQKLLLDGYPPTIRDVVVARAMEVGLIDNRRFADAFIHGKLQAGWGQMRIADELSRRGIDVSTVPGWPEAYFTNESEEERAYALAKTRRVSATNGYQKIVRFLIAKGYSPSVSCRVGRRVVEESGIALSDEW